MSVEIKEANINQLKGLYDQFIRAYFPEDEVKPLSSIERMVNAGYYKVLIAFDAGEIVACAFITGAPGANTYLLDYLAVRDDIRSKGYGGILLKKIAADFGAKHPVMIETETVASAENETQIAQRTKRNAFYQKNGAFLTSLITKIFGVEYTIWYLSDGPSNLDFAEEMRAIYHFMVDEKLYGDNILIP